MCYGLGTLLSHLVWSEDIKCAQFTISSKFNLPRSGETSDQKCSRSIHDTKLRQSLCRFSQKYYRIIPHNRIPTNRSLLVQCLLYSILNNLSNEVIYTAATALLGICLCHDKGEAPDISADWEKAIGYLKCISPKCGFAEQCAKVLEAMMTQMSIFLIALFINRSLI